MSLHLSAVLPYLVPGVATTRLFALGDQRLVEVDNLGGPLAVARTYGFSRTAGTPTPGTSAMVRFGDYVYFGGDGRIRYANIGRLREDLSSLVLEPAVFNYGSSLTGILGSLFVFDNILYIQQRINPGGASEARNANAAAPLTLDPVSGAPTEVGSLIAMPALEAVTARGTTIYAIDRDFSFHRFSNVGVEVGSGVTLALPSGLPTTDSSGNAITYETHGMTFLEKSLLTMVRQEDSDSRTRHSSYLLRVENYGATPSLTLIGQIPDVNIGRGLIAELQSLSVLGAGSSSAAPAPSTEMVPPSGLVISTPDGLELVGPGGPTHPQPIRLIAQVMRGTPPISYTITYTATDDRTDGRLESIRPGEWQYRAHGTGSRTVGTVTTFTITATNAHGSTSARVSITTVDRLDVFDWRDTALRAQPTGVFLPTNDSGVPTGGIVILDGAVSNWNLTIRAGDLPASAIDAIITAGNDNSTKPGGVTRDPDDVLAFARARQSHEALWGGRRLSGSGDTHFGEITVKLARAVSGVTAPTFRTTSGTTRVAPGGAVRLFTETASSYEQTFGGPVIISWSSDAGQLTVADERSGHGTWTAPMTRGTYTVTLTVSNFLGSASASVDFIVGEALPDAVRSLRAAGRSGSVALSWAAPEYTGWTSISKYEIEASSTGTGGWTSVGSGSSLSFTDTGLTSGVKRFYRVRAVNSAGNGAWSSVVSATPR